MRDRQLSAQPNLSFYNRDSIHDVAQCCSKRAMSADMTGGDTVVHVLIEKLEGALDYLDENDLAVPAIKVEEAINALRHIPADDSPETDHD